MNLTKKCPYCGTVMPTGARQCMFCGQMQPDNDATQLQSGDNDATQYQNMNENTQRVPNSQNGYPQSGGYPPYYPPQTPPEKNGSNKNILFILLAALLLAGIGVGAYFLLKDKGDTTKTEHKVITGNDSSKNEKGGTKDIDDGKTDDIKPVKEEPPVEEPIKEEVKPVTPPVTSAETTKNYSYNGSITYKKDIWYFQMNLDVKGSNVTGSLFISNGARVWVPLKGTVDSSGKAIIRENNGSGYYFDGYLSSTSYSGEYKNDHKKTIMTFSAYSN